VRHLAEQVYIAAITPGEAINFTALQPLWDALIDGVRADIGVTD
jgi:hypothetical protein